MHFKNFVIIHSIIRTVIQRWWKWASDLSTKCHISISVEKPDHKLATISNHKVQKQSKFSHFWILHEGQRQLYFPSKSFQSIVKQENNICTGNEGNMSLIPKHSVREEMTKVSTCNLTKVSFIKNYVAVTFKDKSQNIRGWQFERFKTWASCKVFLVNDVSVRCIYF